MSEYVTCRKHATKTAAENIENGHCLSWKFNHFDCDLVKTIKAHNLRAGDSLVIGGSAYTVSDAFKHYRTGRIVADVLGYPGTPTFAADEDVEILCDEQ